LFSWESCRTEVNEIVKMFAGVVWARLRGGGGDVFSPDSRGISFSLSMPVWGSVCIFITRPLVGELDTPVIQGSHHRPPTLTPFGQRREPPSHSEGLNRDLIFSQPRSQRVDLTHREHFLGNSTPPSR
jgi:hypothetical protein